jgi:hypothetical protein
MLGILKTLLPEMPRPVRVLRGPFRGAAITMSPRHSLRKVLGIYERELNHWVDEAIDSVVRVVDVGANDGYFTLGCAAAFRRRKKTGEVIAFEPKPEHVRTLMASVDRRKGDHIRIVDMLVGSRPQAGSTTLDAVQWTIGDPGARDDTLIKIDVEGSEVEVLKGAASWLRPTNRFLIEVHAEALGREIDELFAAEGMSLRRIDQSAFPVIGREHRSGENFWLVSDLGAGA